MIRLAVVAFMLGYTLLLAKFNIKLIQSIYKAGGGDPYSEQWHFDQSLLNCFVFLFGCLLDWRVAIIWPAYHWLVFDGLLNVYCFVGLRTWFFVGTTSATDKWLRRFAHPERMAAIFKFTLLAISVAASVFI